MSYCFGEVRFVNDLWVHLNHAADVNAGVDVSHSLAACVDGFALCAAMRRVPSIGKSDAVETLVTLPRRSLSLNALNVVPKQHPVFSAAPTSHAQRADELQRLTSRSSREHLSSAASSMCVAISAEVRARTAPVPLRDPRQQCEQSVPKATRVGSLSPIALPVSLPHTTTGAD